MKLFVKTNKIWCSLHLVALLSAALLPSTVWADYIRIKGTVVNVRQGPGTSHPVLFQAEQGEEFDLVSTEGLWCLIKIQPEKEAWVFRKLVSVIEGTRPGAISAEEEAETADAPTSGLPWITQLILILVSFLLAATAIIKRKEIFRFAGARLREISGYKREQAFRYDNRKPSDDSWEL